MRAFPVFALLAAVAAHAADHNSLRKQPCDKDCQIKQAQSKVDDAEEALDTNMKASSANSKMIAYTKSIKGNFDIATQEKAVATETQTSALGHMLGSMWGEMREYQTPMYEEKLVAQSSQLADEHDSLQVKLARARGELDAVTEKEAAQEKAETDGDEEVPPAKLVIKITHDSKEDDEKDDDDDEEEDDDKEPTTRVEQPAPPKLQTLRAARVHGRAEADRAEAEEDAEAVAEEAEQEVDDAKAKKEVDDAKAKKEPAPIGKPWSNDGLANGMSATADQHAQLWKHGLSAGDPGRKGMYPADLSAPIPETPLTPKESFGKKTVVEAPEEPEPAPAPKPAAKVSTEPDHVEAPMSSAAPGGEAEDEDEEADAVTRAEAASKEAKEEDEDSAEDAGDEDDDEAKEKAPTKAVAGEGDIGDGMSATHHQLKKFMSGGFFNGDARKGIYPVDLAK